MATVSVDDPARTEKISAATYESLAYARFNGLFFSFKDEDHWKIHEGIREASLQSLTPADLGLAQTKLQGLGPPKNIADNDWSIPQNGRRIVREAWRRMTPSEIRAVEADCLRGQMLLSRGAGSRPTPSRKQERQRLSKRARLEGPLLPSLPGKDDGEELQKTVATLAGQDESRVRNHGIPVEGDNESPNGFAFVSPEQKDRVRSLEESNGIEQWDVSDEDSQLLEGQMSDLKWTEDDQRMLIEQQLAYEPKFTRRYVTPPLTPISVPMEYLVLDGEGCVVSEASTLSSRVSEALEEAERTLDSKTMSGWTAEEAPYPQDSDYDAALFIQDADTWPANPRGVEEEDEIRLNWDKTSSHEPTQESPSIMAGADSSPLPLTDFAPDEAPEDYSMDYSLLSNVQFDESTDILLDLDDSHSQAKLPVPDLGTGLDLPPWTAVLDARGMFQWIQENNEAAFAEPPDDGNFTVDFLKDFQQLKPKEPFDSQTPAFMDDILHELSQYNPLEHQLSLMRSWIPSTAESTIGEQALEDHPETPRRPTSPRDNGAEDAATHCRKKRKLEDRKAKKPLKKLTRQTSIRNPQLILGLCAFENTEKPQTASPKGNRATATYAQSDAIMSPLREDGDDIMATSTMPCPPIDTLNVPDIVVLSTSVPRTIRSHLLHSLPSLKYVERDYQNSPHGPSVEEDEADIVTPFLGLIMTTMVYLRQSGSSGGSRNAGVKTTVLQQRVAKLSAKHDQLRVIIYRSQKRGGTAGSCVSSPEFSPSDAMAYAQLQGFARNLAGQVRIFYVSGGEGVVAQWAASLLCQSRHLADVPVGTERFLSESVTSQETALCRAGLNVYDAQVILGLLCEEHGNREAAYTGNPSQLISRLRVMPVDEKMTRFGSHLSCRRALERLGEDLTGQP